MITVAIAEDHQSLVDGIQLLLEYEDDISVIGTANDGEALLKIINRRQPKVVLTDLKMPKMDGITLCRTIKKAYPQIKVIGFSMFEQEDAVRQMIEAGVSGYLLKNTSLQEVLKAIRAVAAGETYFDPSLDVETLSQKSKSPKIKPLLSKSEKEILRLIGEGKTTSEIAQLRFTAVSTVEKHRKNMIRKLGLSGKGELLRYALESKYDFDS